MSYEKSYDDLLREFENLRNMKSKEFEQEIFIFLSKKNCSKLPVGTIESITFDGGGDAQGVKEVTVTFDSVEISTKKLLLAKFR